MARTTEVSELQQSLSVGNTGSSSRGSTAAPLLIEGGAAATIHGGVPSTDTSSPPTAVPPAACAAAPPPLPHPRHAPDAPPASSASPFPSPTPACAAAASSSLDFGSPAAAPASPGGAAPAERLLKRRGAADAAAAASRSAAPRKLLQVRAAARFMQGRRPQQEDRHVLLHDAATLVVDGADRAAFEALQCNPTAVIALFDGHCGSACSDFCATVLPERAVSYLVKPLPKSKSKQLAAAAATHAVASSSPYASSLSLPVVSSSSSAGGSTTSATAAAASRGSRSTTPTTVDEETTRAAGSSSISPAGAAPAAFSSSSPSDGATLLMRLPVTPPGPVPDFPGMNKELQQLFPSIGARLASAFRHTDRDFLSKYRAMKVGGCTAVLLLVLGPVALVASVGDSRAVAGVLLRKNKKWSSKRRCLADPASAAASCSSPAEDGGCRLAATAAAAACGGASSRESSTHGVEGAQCCTSNSNCCAAAREGSDSAKTQAGSTDPPVGYCEENSSTTTTGGDAGAEALAEIEDAPLQLSDAEENEKKTAALNSGFSKTEDAGGRHKDSSESSSSTVGGAPGGRSVAVAPAEREAEAAAAAAAAEAAASSQAKRATAAAAGGEQSSGEDQADDEEGEGEAEGGADEEYQWKAVRVTRDHKPDDPEEKERIEKNGGLVLRVGGVARVAPKDYEDRAKRHKREQCLHGSATQPPPVLLAVSRGLGDRELKEERLLTATPDVTALRLTGEIRMLVVACDGVWDVMTDEEVVRIASQHLHDPQEAASQVVKRAFQLGSQDNLTSIVVVFDYQGDQVLSS